MFVLLLFFQNVNGLDTSNNAYVLENIDSCPDIGYFFKRESNPNALEQSCHLCFCKDNGTTVCWQRDSRRCDKKNYYHLGKRTRLSRLRRSPSLSDIFFRDAARDIFNKQMPSEQCKPYESSYSEGCPPADWCIGCTVCDCDANGRWDCHILSFCTEDKGKKQIKKRNGSRRNKIAKRQLSTKMPTRTTTKKFTKKPSVPNVNKKQVSKPLKQNKKQINPKNHKIESLSKKTPMKNFKALPQKKNIPERRHINLNKKTTQPVKKAKKVKNPNTKIIETKNINKTDVTAVFAESILKKVMASVEKFLNESQKLINKSHNTLIQKRSISKQVNAKTNTKVNKNLNNSRSKSIMVNKMDKKQSKKKVLTKKEKLGIHFRRKREVMTENFENMRVEDNRTISESKLQDVIKITNKYLLENTTFDNLDVLNYFSFAVNSGNATKETIFSKKGASKAVSYVNEINRNTETNNSVPIVYKELKTITTSKNSQNNTIKDNFKANLLVDTTFKNMTQNFIEIDVNNNKSCGKVCEFKKTLHNFFLNFRKKNSTTIQNKREKFNIIRHMKIFIKKIFQTTKIKGKKLANNKMYPFRKRNFIKTICQNFSSCNYNYTDKVLHSKLNQLKVESNRIIKSVKIIKGLLKLLSSNKSNSSKIKQNSENLFHNNDEQILIAILKDEHEAFLLNLTETQRIQVRYIKENTLIFIKSVENLANVLEELVDYVTNRKNIKTKKLPRPYHRYLRKKQNMININQTVSQKLDRLKELLVHYNLVQNKFMKQMYDVISTLESRRNTTAVRIKPKVSYKNENKNDTLAIDNYVKNIITNLRKLKDLAQKLSSKSRRKRSAMGDEDAIEYLLTLMEYILKQTQPLDASVNDGIDLIIEAIKSSPDVKPIKNKAYDFSETTEDITNSISQENYLYNITQIQAPKTFKSLDDEDINLTVHNVSNDEKEYPIFVEENIILTTQSHKKIYDDIDLKVNANGVKVYSENKQKFEIFFDDDEDDTTVEKISTTNNFETEATTTEFLKTIPTKTKISDKNLEEPETDIKTRIDWIDEAYINEKQKIIEASTEKLIKATRTSKQNDKYENGITSVSEENIENNDNLKAHSDEVYKRQMNLFNTLDYRTEKSVLDSVSREEKYTVETFPSYLA